MRRGNRWGNRPASTGPDDAGTELDPTKPTDAAAGGGAASSPAAPSAGRFTSVAAQALANSMSNTGAASMPGRVAAVKAAAAAGGGGGDGDELDESAGEDPLRPGRVLDAAIKVRADTLKATQRILRDLERAKEIEQEALQVLHADLERMRRMDDQLNQIDSTMSRARLQITALGRRLVKDGCFKILCTLLIIVIVVLIILVVSQSLGKIGSFAGSAKKTIATGGGDDATTTKAP